MRLLAGLIIMATFLAGSVIAPAEVMISEDGPKTNSRAFFGNSVPEVARIISIRNESRVPYDFKYVYFPAGGQAPAKPFPAYVRFPYIGDQTSGTSGLGLIGGGWYEGGFFDVLVNGKGLGGTLANDIRVRSGKEEGEVRFVWEPEWATTTLRCLLKARDEKMYVIIDVNPKEQVKEIKVKLLAYPGGDRGKTFPHDRWICTPSRNIQHSDGKTDVNPESECWLYCFDSGINDRGSCAVVFLPEEIMGATADPSNNSTVNFLLNCHPDQRRVRLLLMSFPRDYKKPHRAYDLIKTSAPAFFETLRTLK